MDDNELLMIVLAFVVGYMASNMMKSMCSGRLVEGTSDITRFIDTTPACLRKYDLDEIKQHNSGITSNHRMDVLCNAHDREDGCMILTLKDPKDKKKDVKMCKWDTSGTIASVNQDNCMETCQTEMNSNMKTIEDLYNSDKDTYWTKQENFLDTYDKCTKNCNDQYLAATGVS